MMQWPVCDAEGTGGTVCCKNSTFGYYDVRAAWTPRLQSPTPIMVPAIYLELDNI